MVTTETHIGEFPSFLSAKRVVLLVTVFFTFICFFGGVIVWKKAAKEIYPHCCSVENDDARAVFSRIFKSNLCWL